MNIATILEKSINLRISITPLSESFGCVVLFVGSFLNVRYNILTTVLIIPTVDNIQALF